MKNNFKKVWIKLFGKIGRILGKIFKKLSINKLWIIFSKILRIIWGKNANYLQKFWGKIYVNLKKENFN